ncbi:unnamed protein product [Dovyalis caffra]|uniref:Uncharacterized protein n=1 Tax=Dovyalis caffra TaxID=77055 RepID=A0AAV1SV45_9ROSI|nr:unnamed protein product [Dovyalis caffra]
MEPEALDLSLSFWHILIGEYLAAVQNQSACTACNQIRLVKYWATLIFGIDLVKPK